MAGNSLVTSVTGTNVDAVAGKQKPYWVEVQLVDEEGGVVGGIPGRPRAITPAKVA